jgi:hypothetical protein
MSSYQGAVSIAISANGVGLNLTWSSGTMGNGNSPGKHDQIALSSGANTLTPPANAVFAVLVPPANSTITKTFKGVTGDTGYQFNVGMPALIPLASAPGTFVITASGSEQLDVYWI